MEPCYSEVNRYLLLAVINKAFVRIPPLCRKISALKRHLRAQSAILLASLSAPKVSCTPANPLPLQKKLRFTAGGKGQFYRLQNPLQVTKNFPSFEHASDTNFNCSTCPLLPYCSLCYFYLPYQSHVCMSSNRSFLPPPQTVPCILFGSMACSLRNAVWPMSI